MNTKELERLVALTFDSDPKVRKEAAIKLGDQDDPIASFALIELTTDKDKEVRETAKRLLEERKKKEPELLSFADIFEAGAKKEEKEEIPVTQPALATDGSKEIDEEKKKKMLLSPIERMFERKFGKEKAEVVKKKLMPSIERVYEKNIEGGKKKEEKRGFLQQFINDYFSVVEEEESKNIEEPEEEGIHKVELDEIGFKETDELVYNPEEQDSSIKGASIDEAIFNHFYNIAVEANGSAVVKHALYKEMKSKIDLAFSMIEKERKKVQSLSDLRKGMRSFTSETLHVKKVGKGVFRKSKRAEPQEYVRIEVEDEKGGSAVIYVFDKDVSAVKEGMKIVVERAPVKEFNGENSIHISKSKGSLYIVV
ncbi:MAG: HEAT repeat domain-containing protein [Candidatus Anstonellales archaeon]